MLLQGQGLGGGGGGTAEGRGPIESGSERGMEEGRLLFGEGGVIEKRRGREQKAVVVGPSDEGCGREEGELIGRGRGEVIALCAERGGVGEGCRRATRELRLLLGTLLV